VDLTTSLHAAAGDPPPTRIDLDALIRTEVRRGYRQRRLFGAGAVSGVAVLVGAASLGWPLGARAPVGDGGGPVCPWVSPSGDPSIRPRMASASPLPPPVSPPVSPSMSLSESSPNVEVSGSPASPPPAIPPSASATATWPGPMPSASAGRLSPVPDQSPPEVCADTLRHLERVLTDALARIAPDAHPTAPIRFFTYHDGTVRAVVFFSRTTHLEVVLYPQWAGSTVGLRLSVGGAYQFRSPGHGLVLAVTSAGPLTSTQMDELANEPGLTLTD